MLNQNRWIRWKFSSLPGKIKSQPLERNWFYPYPLWKNKFLLFFMHSCIYARSNSLIHGYKNPTLMATEWPVVHTLQRSHEIIVRTKQDIGKLHVSHFILACHEMGWPLRSRKMCWVGWPGISWQDMTQNIPLMSRRQKCQIPQESWNPRKWVQGSEEDNDRTFNWCSRA